MVWGLPRVVLDHELLVEIERHLVATGLIENGSRQLGGIHAQPLRRLVRFECFLGHFERLAIAMGFADLDPITGPELIGRYVRRAAVDREMAVGHELTRGRSRWGEA